MATLTWPEVVGMTTDGPDLYNSTTSEPMANGMDPETMAKVVGLIDTALKLTLVLYVPILLLGLVGNSLSFPLLLHRAKTSSTYNYLVSLSVMDSIFLLSSIGKL